MSSPIDPGPDPERAPAVALQRALRAHGLPVDVECDGAMAVLVPEEGSAVPDWPAVRAQVVRLAREHGFRNVGVEVRTDGATPHPPQG